MIVETVETINENINGINDMPRQQISPTRYTKGSGRQTWGQKARERIDSTLIVERLQRVALDQEEATQVSLMACKMLLDRTLPTIKPMEVKQSDGGNAKSITNDQLFQLIESKAVK